MKTNPKVPALLLGLLLFTGCDVLEQVSGTDPVKDVVRDNPVDASSLQPLIASVDGGGTVPTVRPAFRYVFGKNVDSYTLQISGSQEFATPLAYEEAGIQQESHRIATPLANHQLYYWRVQPRYSDGTVAPWSESRQFTTSLHVPTAFYPNLGTLVNTPVPEFTWSSVEGVEYEMQISDNSAFTNAQSTTRTTGKLKLSAGLPHQSHRFWRVRAADGIVVGDWGATQEFSVSIPLPLPLSPDEGAWIHFQSFGWGYYTLPPGCLGFEWQLSESNLFSEADTLTAKIVAPDQSYSLASPLTPMTSYYWRVRLDFGDYGAGPWTVVRTITRDPLSRFVPYPTNANQFPASLRLATDDAFRVHISPMGTISFTSSAFVQWAAQVGYGVQVIAEDGTTYIGSYPYSSPRSLVALAKDGTIQWNFVFQQGEIRGGPVLGSDGTIYVRVTTPGQTLYAINPDGSLKWKFETGLDFNNEYPVSPAVGSGGVVYLPAGKNLYAVNPDGTQRWKASFDPYFRLGWLAIGKGGRIFLSSDSFSVLYALNSDGTEYWHKNESYWREPVIDSEGTLYLSRSSYYLDALRENGTLKWSIPSGSANAILGDNGILYVRSHTVYDSALLRAISTVDGSVQWKCDLDFVTGGFLMNSHGVLYVTTGFGIAEIPTTSHGIATEAPWPMADHDAQGTRRAGP